jgi:hypothetical protein
MEETRIDVGKIIKDLFIRQNVFYLLSALFMILGCYLALKPFQQVTRSLADLIIYFALINTYEALLVITAIYITVKKNVVRDGVVLLFLECFFLADATLMNSVYYLQGLWTGITINAIILLLAGLKVFFVARYLKLLFPRSFYLFLALGLAYLYMFTAFAAYELKQVYDKSILLYIIWTVAGLIPLFLIRIKGNTQANTGALSELARKAQVILPLIIIGLTIIHLATFNWIVSETFYPCFLSTFLISLATILPEFMPRLKEEKRLIQLQYALILAGILFTLGFPNILRFKWLVTFSPLTISLVLSAMAFVYFGLIYRRVLYGVYSVLLITTALIGSDAEIIIERIEKGIEWVFRKLPRTSKDWGILSIIAAFVLFLIGFLISLRKSKYQSQIEEQPSLPDSNKSAGNIFWFNYIVKLILKSGLIVIGLILLLFIVGVIFDTGCPTKGAANEASAITVLKVLEMQEKSWCQGDTDGNGIKDYWTLDVSTFYRLYRNDGRTKLKLIDISLARADSAAYSRNNPTPFNFGNESGLDLEDWSHPDVTPTAKSGYRFQAMLLDENGLPYNKNPIGKNGIKACNSTKFAFVAYPQVYPTSGINTFIINEKGIIYQTDPNTDGDGKIVLQWPGADPTEVKGPGGKLWSVAE